MVGHSKRHLVLYLNVPSLQKSHYTEVYIKITSHNIILHMDHSARWKAMLQLLLLHCTMCRGPCSIVQYT